MSNLKSLKSFKEGPDSRRNTKGRPAASYSQTKLQEIFNSKSEELIPGTNITYEEGIIQRWLFDALKGKFNAYRLYMLYRYGKPGKRNIFESSPKDRVIEWDPKTKKEGMDAIRRYLDQRKKY